MGYQSRKRNYQSRRERYLESLRKLRVVIIFALIALTVLILKNRVAIWDWLRWQF